MLTRGHLIAGSLAAFSAGALPSVARSSTKETALDRYIARPTPEYRYDVISTIDGDGYRAHVLSMVSQRWRTAAEVDQPIWKHWLTIIEPRPIKTRVAALIVSGGSSGDKPPNKVSPVAAQLAVRLGAVVAELHDVPNQPLTFAHDTTARGEDDLIAYTWDRYLRTGDETWPLRLPMTKAAVRAMDTITAFTRRGGGEPVVDRFVVGGASKRGWTTWTTAAADKRVVAIVPVVIDLLNIVPSAIHEYRVYGEWPEALQSYEKLGIMKWLGKPQLEALLRIEDPYEYRDRLALPKLLVNATGDQFFVPDSWRFYLGDIPGENHLRYVPNTDHSLKGATIDAGQTALAFMDTIIAGKPRPRFTWQSEPDGTIRVRSTTQPKTVKLWRAVNERARDFRFETIGPAFNSTELEDQGGFTYAARVSAPARGFAASFVELTYAGPRDEPFVVTTGVRVTPDVLPFGPPPGS
jgi:PhoPQ-activated pathogenicity-related protein